MDLKGNNTRFIKDIGWYLFGALIPMGVGFIKTPIFTRYFTPEEYGYLGIITITFSYISIFIYSWLASCLWRYYNAFKTKNDLKSLYSNMFGIFLSASLLLLIITGIWYFLAENKTVKQLIILSFLLYFIKEFIGLYLIVIRLEGKALKYNLIHSSRAVLSFAILYLMTFGYGYRITSVLISVIVIDVVVLLFIFLTSKENISFSVRSISRNILKMLFKFGSMGLIAGFSFLLITSSDRYIIVLFTDMSTVGIYNQVYNICQLSIVALVTVYFNTINPLLTRELEVNFKNSDDLISKYIYVFLLFGLPLVTYFCLFSKEMAVILLGEEFRSGDTIMPWVFISAFLYGLIMFIETKFKFADKLKAIATGVLIAAVINIILNFVFIPLYGYKMAAITTFISYLFLFVYFYSQDSAKFFKNYENVKHVILFLTIIFIQVVADFIIRKYFFINVFYTAVEGFVFLLIYLAILRRHIKKINVPM